MKVDKLNTKGTLAIWPKALKQPRLWRCPFCAGPAQLRKATEAPRLGGSVPYVVECIRCWSRSNYLRTVRLVVAAWNRRAS